VWAFVTDRASKKKEADWFSAKDFSRFRASITESAKRVQAHEDVENSEQKYVKYWLDTVLCRFVGDPRLPDKPEWILLPLFTGWTARCVSRRLAQGPSHKVAASFVYTLQKGCKQMWAPMSEESKELALQKHKTRLSQVHGLLPNDLQNRIREISFVVFGPRKNESPATKFVPSGSACLQASRRSGGALSLFEPYQLPTFSKKKSGLFDVTTVASDSKCVVSVEARPSVLATKSLSIPIERSFLGRLPTLVHSVDEWRQRNFELSLRHVLADIVLDSPTDLSPSFRHDPKILDVSVMAIPEPGKFRIITKGDGLLYTALQPLQGQMLDAWKNHPSSTMRDEDLLPRVKQIALECAELPFWCSVDYEAATDLVKRQATIAAFSGCDRFGLYDLGEFSLQEGVAIYPEQRDSAGRIVRTEQRVQINDAQLMGHPLSFPLLCVINLAVFHRSIDKWLKELRKKFEKSRLVFGTTQNARHFSCGAMSS
jgi:hypothetical protein